MPTLASIQNLRYSFLLASSRVGLLQHFNFDLRKKLKGRSFVLPISDGIGYQNLVSTEPWATELYKKILSNFEGSFIDVGVNNGQTILKIASINPKQSYIGFEPNPVCYNYSRKLIRKNKLTSFSLIPVGLHYESKIVELYHDTEFASGASMLSNFRVKKERYNQVQNVSVLAGDKVLEDKNISAISIIKADVEGVELEVMMGLKQSLSKFKPLVLLEILPVYNTSTENGRFRKERQDQLINLMTGLDYQMMLVNEKAGTLSRLQSIEVHGDMSKTNYLFAHKKCLSKLENIFTIQ
ncbi:MAG: FkbM family methyltransferase [Chitinophagaceae bacterium]|nr:FkbM family methyltransferase [Chitinophagaceae bacterium]